MPVSPRVGIAQQLAGLGCQHPPALLTSWPGLRDSCSLLTSAPGPLSSAADLDSRPRTSSSLPAAAATRGLATCPSAVPGHGKQVLAGAPRAPHPFLGRQWGPPKRQACARCGVSARPPDGCERPQGPGHSAGRQSSPLRAGPEPVGRALPRRPCAQGRGPERRQRLRPPPTQHCLGSGPSPSPRNLIKLGALARGRGG